jgi:hypothetical protein
MMTSRVSILVLVAGALGGCVTDAHSDDPESDLDTDLAERRRPRPAPAPVPDPGPGTTCALIGGPSTLGATLQDIQYEVTGGPAGIGNGTSLYIAESGWSTLRTTEGGTDQGWLEIHLHYGLFVKATQAELPTRCKVYSCEGCSDDYVHNLTVRMNNVPYTVRASFRAVLPERLATLITAVRNINTSSLQ